MWQRRHQNFENGQWIDCTKEDAVKFGPAGSYGGWEIRDLPSNTMPTADEIAVIQRLLDLARQVDHALDDSEEVACDGFRSHNIDGRDFADVVEALDALADLPDDKPGMTLGPAGKAEWALRRLLDPVIRGRAEHNELIRADNRHQGTPMTTHTSGAADLPEALRIAAALEYCDASVAREAINELRRLAALTAQAPNQPGGFSSGDMASAAAQGYRDGWTAAQADSVLEDALSDALRVPLDSLHADAAYLIGRLRDGSMPYARVIEIIRERIDAAKAAIRARAAHGQAPASVLHLVHSAFAEIAMAFPKAFALHKVGIADTAVREALAAPAAGAVAGPSEAVAYLDIGTGGYLDLGTDLADEALSRLPKGRHALVIAGTYGIDGYTAAPTPQSAPPPQAAPAGVLEDAARWHWMAEYIVGTRTDLDDELIASATVDELRKLVDADLAARKQGANHD